MNDASLKVLKEEIKKRSSELLEIMEDLAKDESLTHEQSIAVVGLMSIAGWGDATCAMIDLIGIDHDERKEIQEKNRVILTRFAAWFSEE